VNFDTLAIKNVRDSYGGSVWCIAANPKSPTLAIGCEDGSVKLFSYADGGLEYSKLLATPNSRVLCVAFHPILPTMAIGCSDSSIRYMDEKTGKSLFRLTCDIVSGIPTYIWSIVIMKDSTIITGDNTGQIQFWDGAHGTLQLTIHKHQAAIYAIALNEDETQIFASGVDSKVICISLVSNASADSDTKANDNTETALDNRTSNDTASSEGKVWVYSNAIRAHSHDVTSLAIINRQGSSILLSGSLDCKLCLYTIDNFITCRPVWIMPVPATNIMKSSLDNRITVLKHFDTLSLWKLGRPDINKSSRNTEMVNINNDEQHRLMCQIKSISSDNIGSIAISNNGDMLAYACGRTLYVWKIEKKTDNTDKIVLKKLEVNQHIILDNITSITSLVFNNNSTTLAVSVSSSSNMNYIYNNISSVNHSIILIDINHPLPVTITNSNNGNNNTIKKKSKKNNKNNIELNDIHIDNVTNITNGGEITLQVRDIIKCNNNNNHNNNDSQNLIGKSLNTVFVQLAVSNDNVWLAGRSCGYKIDIYDLDRSALHWTVPSYNDIPVTCVAFHPTSHNILVVTYANNMFLLYDVNSKDLCPYSKENNMKECMTKMIELSSTSLTTTTSTTINSTKSIFDILSSINCNLEGISFDPSNSSGFMLYGQGSCVYIDIEQPIYLLNSNKRKRQSNNNNVKDTNTVWKQRRNFAVLNTYRSLVHVSLIENSDMVY
jgi:U3 small nucleolar RNA-associated protein 4